jgi:hypothetical protein
MVDFCYWSELIRQTNKERDRAKFDFYKSRLPPLFDKWVASLMLFQNEVEELRAEGTKSAEAVLGELNLDLDRLGLE